MHWVLKRENKNMTKIGVLITNTGTPDDPTAKSVRRYLREFLSDKRVVQIPKIMWLPILYGLVLPLRPKKSAKLYQKIWTPAGSPMRVIMQRLTTELQNKLLSQQIEVVMGMNYGNPSIPAALSYLQSKLVDEIAVLPLFPQYSHTTTASTFDRVSQFNFRSLHRDSPHLIYIESYADDTDYIKALASSVRSAWATRTPAQHLLISFHGIPQRFVQAGDPYQSQCETTTRLLAEALKLTPEQWTLCYQSQFGYDKWLKPSTQDLFVELPKRGIKNIDVICPGFAIDCLETLEEIAIRGEETFIHAGGEKINYIPALNESNLHVNTLANVILQQLQPE